MFPAVASMRHFAASFRVNLGTFFENSVSLVRRTVFLPDNSNFGFEHGFCRLLREENRLGYEKLISIMSNV